MYIKYGKGNKDLYDEAVKIAEYLGYKEYGGTLNSTRYKEYSMLYLKGGEYQGNNSKNQEVDIDLTLPRKFKIGDEVEIIDSGIIYPNLKNEILFVKNFILGKISKNGTRGKIVNIFTKGVIKYGVETKCGGFKIGGNGIKKIKTKNETKKNKYIILINPRPSDLEKYIGREVEIDGKGINTIAKKKKGILRKGDISYYIKQNVGSWNIYDTLELKHNSPSGTRFTEIKIFRVNNKKKSNKNKILKKDLIIELENKEREIENYIEENNKYYEEIKHLKEKKEELENIIIKKEDEIERRIEEYKKEQIKKIVNKKKGVSFKKGKAWENIIIDDLTYKKLSLSFKTKMPLLLKGQAGIGKSTFIKALAEDKKIDLVQYNFNGDTTVEHLLGHKILVGQKTKTDSPMVFEDGPLTDAVRNGKIFLADEINSSSAEIQFILNGLLELKDGKLGKLVVQGNNGEVIEPHPNFRFYGTYNPGYLGTKNFGMSIMSRFIGIEIKPLNESDEIALLVAKYPKLSKEIELLVKLENSLRNNKNFTYDISTRDLLQTLMFIDGGFSIKEALDATIINSCQLDLDLQEFKQACKNILYIS